MTITPRSLAGMLVLLPALAAPGSADARGFVAPVYAKADIRFTTTTPNSPSGVVFSVALKPVVGQPPVVRSNQIVAPRGTRFDIGAVPTCSATDERIGREGPKACPPRSAFGTGTARVWIGAADELAATVSAFSIPRGLMLVLTSPSGTVIRVLRATATSSGVQLLFPRVPLADGKEATLTRFRLDVPRLGTAKRPLFRTPKRCPASDAWTWTYLPVFDSPLDIQRSTSESRCNEAPRRRARLG